MASRHPEASRMESARIAAGYSVAEVAGKLGRCATTCRRWELGRTTPPQHVLLLLADLYRVTPSDLVNG